MSRRQAPLPRREASFSSAASSRTSSRASTPPTTSTPPRSYLAAAAAAAAPRTLIVSLTDTPSIATLLHYISLLLSIRLVVVSPRWTTFLLCLCLATTLEGRAKAERLGLRNTMRGVMTAVSAGVAWSNMATIMGDELASAQEGSASGLSDLCPRSSQPLLKVSSNRGQGDGLLMDVAVAICDQGPRVQLPVSAGTNLTAELLDKAAAWIEGKGSGGGRLAGPAALCELVAEGVPTAGSFSIAIAAQPRDTTKGMQGIDVTVKC